MKAMSKIDVCLVTKNPVSNAWLRNLKGIPLNKLIIERSSPLGLARMRAIQKVNTEWFAFIDDDVYLTQDWFSELTNYISEKVGAIEGYPRILVSQIWQEIFDMRKRNMAFPQRLKAGQRGYTYNVLMRADLVKDWRPSSIDLSAWEDYELTQHVIEKGYDWIRADVKGFHDSRGIIALWNQIMWSSRGEKRVNGMSAKILIKSICNSVHTVLKGFLRLTFYRKKVYLYWIFIGIAKLWGLMFA